MVRRAAFRPEEPKGVPVVAILLRALDRWAAAR